MFITLVANDIIFIFIGFIANDRNFLAIFISGYVT